MSYLMVPHHLLVQNNKSLCFMCANSCPISSRIYVENTIHKQHLQTASKLMSAYIPFDCLVIIYFKYFVNPQILKDALSSPLQLLWATLSCLEAYVSPVNRRSRTGTTHQGQIILNVYVLQAVSWNNNHFSKKYCSVYW